MYGGNRIKKTDNYWCKRSWKSDCEYCSKLDTVIGKECIINTRTSVECDCKLEDYVNISVESCVAGICNSEERTWA